MNTTSNEKSYFDLHTRASATSSVSVKCLSGAAAVRSPFLACTIAALVGPAKGPQLPLFRRQGLGAEAKKLVSATSALTIPSSARWCAFASVTCGAMRTSATRVSRRVRPPRPQGATAEGRTDRPGRTGFDRAARADHPRHRLSQPPEGRHPKMAIRSCRAPSRHWPGLSMNRSTGTSTPSSPPRKPSIWFAGACRPSKGSAGADRLPSERHEDRSVHPHKGEHAGEPAQAWNRRWSTSV